MTAPAWPPFGTTAWHLEDEAQLLIADSTLLAFVPSPEVDTMLRAAVHILDGSQPLSTARADGLGGGFICDLDSEGWLVLTVRVKDGAVHAAEVLVDDEDNIESHTDRWFTVTTLTCATTTVVCGDPSLLRHYTEEPFDPPADSHGSWAVMALPAPGQLTIQTLKQGGQPTGANLGIRATWHPAA